MTAGRMRQFQAAAIALLLILELLNLCRFELADGLGSDSFYLVALYRDLFQDGYPLRHWNLPPSNGFFPDAALFFPLMGIFSRFDAGFAMTAYAFVFFILLLGILGAIAGGPGGKKYLPLTYLLLAGILFTAFLQDRSRGTNFILYWAFFPAFHGGILLAGLLLILGFLRATESTAPARWLAMIFAVSMLATFSDALIVPQFIIPLILVAGVWARRISLRRSMSLAAPMVFGALIAVLCLKGLTAAGVFHRPSDDIPFYQLTVKSSEAFARSFRLFVDDFRMFTRENWSAGLVSALWLTVCVVWRIASRPTTIADRELKEPFATHRERVLDLLSLFTLFSFPLTLAAPLVTAIWTDSSCFRYVFPILILPAFFLAILVFHHHREIAPRLHRLLVGLVVVLGVTRVGLAGWTPGIECLRFPYPNSVRFLDRLKTEYNLHFGLGDYWSAKTISCLSRGGLRVNQVDPPLNVYPWINNLAWYLQAPGPNKRIPHYDFIITDRLPADRIVQKFGKPAAVVRDCGIEVFLLPRSADAVIRQWLETTLSKGR